MKRFVRSWLMFTFAAGTFAASGALADAPIKTLPIHLGTTYRVTLTSAPANQAPFASAVTFTAKVTQLPADTMAQGATTLVDPRLRYTFKAQRTSPSADPAVIIATNSPESTVSWNAQNAGDYTVTVHVTAIQSPLIPQHPKLPEVIGDASLPNYKVLPAPTGPDLIVDSSGGVTSSSCNLPDCTQCPYTTHPIYVKNIGNVSVSKQITVTVNHGGQIIQTWTANAPAAGQRVKVGQYTDFTWNCPAILWSCSGYNYVITVDATNAVAETNEQNNTAGWCERFPEKTSFQAAQ